MAKNGPTAQTVRPRASQRKARSTSVDHKARPPQQARSQRRFERILDATRELLKDSNIEDLSFSDIAARAGASAPSVHYMFPSMSALVTELISDFHRQYMAEFHQMENHLAMTEVPSWQEWIRRMADSNRNYFNENRDISELALGPLMNRATSQAITAVNTAFANSISRSLQRLFLLPEQPDLPRKMLRALEVFDGLWGRAYLEQGRIDEVTFEESLHIVIAYLRTILPENLVPRGHTPEA